MEQASAESRTLGVLAIEPYYGGSHRAFLDGWVRASRHRFRLITMPARKWKWRMRGSAMWCVRRLAELEPNDDFDIILTSDMMPVADLRVLLPGHLANLPLVCYFHENQLTYPLAPDDRRDYQYGFTNITSCLAADEVWFNSAFHRCGYLQAVDRLLAEMPDCVPPGVARSIEARSRVMHPGVDLVGIDRPGERPLNDPPVILWNQRWEYDKGPETLFRALFSLLEAEVPFRLRLAGEQFRTRPPIFDEAKRRLAQRIIHFGYQENRREYLEGLASADFVVSTAIHEFFGLAVIEAVAAGCFPILPQRLSYPELIPADLHALVFYQQDSRLREKLESLLRAPPGEAAWRAVVDHARRFAWTRLVADFDEGLERVAGRQTG